MSSLTTALPEIYPGLYQIAAAGSPDEGSSPLWVYFLDSSASQTLKTSKRKKNMALQASPPLSEVTLESSWRSLSGWYFFSSNQISRTQAKKFITSALQAFPPLPDPDSPSHTVLWLPSLTIPDTLTSIGTRQIGPLNTISDDVEMAWSGLGLSLDSGIIVDLVEVSGYPALQFTAYPIDNGRVRLCYYGVLQTIGYRDNGWQITLYLDGPGAGSLNFGVGLDVNQLASSFGCNFCYIAGQVSPQRLQYPLYDLAAPQADNYTAFDVWLNPLLLMTASTTRFQIDLTGRTGPYSWLNHADSLFSGYFFTNNSQPLKLTPIDPWQQGTPELDDVGAGFAFSLRPAATSPLSSELYLSPVGCYSLTSPQTSPSNDAPVQVMPGLFTREYFRLMNGDSIRFINHQPAWAASFSLDASPSEPPVDSLEILAATWTTSWGQWQNLSADRAYFGQPSSASFFAEVHNEAFPIAVDVLLEAFSDSLAFPWVPYGGVFDRSRPNPGVGTDDLTRFEATIIGAVRHSMMTLNSDGPRMFPQNASTPSAALLSATNPQGILVDINGNDGSWSCLTLAMEDAHSDASPPIPQSFLQFLSRSSPGHLPKDLALTLTQNQLFYVVTQPGPDWEFLSSTFLGGFKFNLALDSSAEASLAQKTIMVFKFNTNTTLGDLISRPGLWTAAQSYNKNPAAVSGALQDYVSFAQAEAHAPDNPFENFNRIVNDKEWTGVLFFNADVDGNGMPADLQMLLGGVNGGLRAHHIGIQGNLFDRTSSPVQLNIKKSSLFGVIFYDGDSHPSSPAVLDRPIDYEVEKLIVVFSNSAIAQFNTTVGLTLNSLFGRSVKKRHSVSASPDINPNTLSIKGKYQSNSDGTGRVIFASSEGFTYDMQPASESATLVIDNLTFNQASLVPVSSLAGEKSPDTTVVTAKFILAGQLWFHDDPFPNSGSLDLFSYGTENQGLPVSGLAADIRFTLGADGSMEPGSKSVLLNISDLSAAPVNEAIRTDSLLFSIPLKFSRFLSADSKTPLNASKLNATSVNILQLQNHTDTSAAASPPVSNGLPVSYATSSALYGLEFDMLLGSLGALGASARLNAKVVLAWGPSATVPDNDAAALYVQLPQLSAGAGGFELEGILKTTFGDANLLKVDLDGGEQRVYAFLFNNIQLSVFGYRFPPGILIDFMVFAGASVPGKKEATNANNLAWFLSAQQQKASP